MSRYTEVERDGIIYNTSRIESHPDKRNIDRALVNRMSFAEVSRKWDLPKAEVTKYFKKKLIPQIARSMQEDSKDSVEVILIRLEVIAEKSKKLLDACDKWLTDPENEKEYNLSPRGSELEVVYNELVQTDDGEKKIRKKDSLQRILNTIAGHKYETVRVVSKIADPRELILKTSAEIREELKLVAQITGEIGDATNQININVVGSSLANIVLDATKNDIKTQGIMIDKIRGVLENANENNNI